MTIDFKKPNCTDQTWEGRADCANCPIHARVLLHNIPESNLDHLLSPIANLSYPVNTVLYNAGVKNQAIYTIRQGLIKLVHYLPNGSERTVRLLGQNDMFGLEAIVEGENHHTAITLHDTKLCRIPLDVIRALEKNHPELFHQLLLRWQNNLNVADKFITDFSTGSAESRLARLLLSLSDSSHECGFNHIGRSDIASILGITTETASRIMADLGRRGIVNHVSKTYYTCNPDQLRMIAQDM